MAKTLSKWATKSCRYLTWCWRICPLMARELTAPMPGIGGGVNLRDAPNQLAEDEVRGLNNILLDERGGGVKRRGSTAVSSTAARIISIYTFYRAGATTHILAHYANGDLKYSA